MPTRSDWPVRFVDTRDVRDWLHDQPSLDSYVQTIGRRAPDDEYLEDTLGLPLHLRFVVGKLGAEATDEYGEQLDADVLASIPFHSLCRGLFLPLMSMTPERAGQIFGIQVGPPPDAAGREELVAAFFSKDVGLSLPQKLACVLGDPFRGRRSTFQRDSLIRLLESMQLRSRRWLLDRLTHVGDVAVLFAEARPELHADPPLTAAEVLETLRFLPGERRNLRWDVVRSLLGRCGRVEAFFLAKLLMRNAGFGFEYQGALLARVLGAQFAVAPEQVQHALALTDAFHVARALQDEGAEGLHAIQLQPLSAVRPALAGGTVDAIRKWPVWVERKYDGIRLMLHKSTDRSGAVLCAAYTRARNDWLEMIRGLDQTIRRLPGANVILDGELYATVAGMDRMRPATVYELYHSLTGEGPRAMNTRFAAFDLLYLNGQDLTRQPLMQRRQMLQQLLTPMANWPLPVPVTVSEGQMAASANDVSRLYQHFRAQGFEGVVAKDPEGPYLLSTRDPAWCKRKPAITLDLALLGAVYSVTSKERPGMFGSYVIGALDAGGAFEDIGDVAGVDQVRDREIQGMIMRHGLLTGRRIERPSATGVRPGLELKPHVVVTVRFEGVVRDLQTKKLSLRDPKIVHLRPDKLPQEVDTLTTIEEIHLRERVG